MVTCSSLSNNILSYFWFYMNLPNYWLNAHKRNIWHSNYFPSLNPVVRLNLRVVRFQAQEKNAKTNYLNSFVSIKWALWQIWMCRRDIPTGFFLGIVLSFTLSIGYLKGNLFLENVKADFAHKLGCSGPI